MRLNIYERLTRMPHNRRSVLRGAAMTGAAAYLARQDLVISSRGHSLMRQSAMR